MECTQTKSESEMKVAVSCDTVETDSEDLSENWIEAMLSGRTEKLFSLKFLLPRFFKMVTACLNLYRPVNYPGTAKDTEKVRNGFEYVNSNNPCEKLIRALGIRAIVENVALNPQITVLTWVDK